MRTHKQTVRLEGLEPRALLAAQISDVRMTPLNDHDNDGFARDVVAEVDLRSTTAATDVYLRLLQDNGVAGDSVLFESDVLSIDSVSTTSFQLHMVSDLFALPGSQTNGICKFKVQVIDLASGSVLLTYAQADDADLGNVRLESIAADGGTTGAAPVVASSSITPSSPVTADTVVALTAHSTDASLFGGVLGMLTWIDLNSNGRFDQGTEGETMTLLTQDTGDANDGMWWTNAEAGLRYGIGTFTVLTAAFDDEGNLSNISSTSITVTPAIDPLPLVTSVTVSSSVLTVGSSFSVSAAATDNSAVTQVTFFFDSDGNGVWTQGIDTDLGVDSNGTDGWSITSTVSASWSSGTQQFCAAAMDDASQWSVPVAATARINRPPVVTALTLDSASVSTWGDSIAFHATASDDASITAVTFFVDMNNNGYWTSGVDIDLGADFISADGWTRSLATAQSWGTGNKVIRAAAVDSDGLWSTAAASFTVRVNDRPVIQSVQSSLASAQTGQSVTFTAIPVDTNTSAVTFFRDANNNNRWDGGIDEDLGADFSSAGGWTRTFVVPQNWSGTVRICANAVDTDGAWGNSPLTSTTFVVVPAPTVTALALSPTTFVTWNNHLILTATVLSPTTVRAVTFFYDANSNGRWDAGIDEDLGADFSSAGGWTRDVIVPSRWGAPSAAKFCANAVDTNNTWGAGAFQSGGVRINDILTLSNPSATPNPVTLGSSFNLNVTAIDAFGIGAATFFVDINNDGRWTPGVDVDLGAGSRISGTQTNGVWQRSAIANFGRGTFTIRIDARDTDGVWSAGPIAYQLTVA